MIAFALLVLTALSVPINAAKCRPKPRCPNENGCTSTASNGAVYELKCFTDYNGPTIAVTHGAVFSDCANSCSTTTNCTAYNLKDEFCYLLGANVGTPRVGTIVVAGLQTKAPQKVTPLGATSCGTEIDCDQAATDGCAYESGGKKFVARCNMDFFGSDMSLTSTENLEDCIGNCSITAGCQSVSWSTGTCYLKNGIPKGDFSPWIQGAYLLS